MLISLNFRSLEPYPTSSNKINYLDVTESRVTLQDSYFQLFSDSEEQLTLLNIDPRSEIQVPLPTEHPFTLWISLGNEVVIEGRVVTSFPQLFGDVTGLKDFFNFLIVILLGSSPTRYFNYESIKTFFRVNDDGD